MSEWPEVYPRDLTKKLLSSDAPNFPWVFKCGVDQCYWLTAHASQQQAHEMRDKHQQESCPLKGETHYGPEVKVSILSAVWEELDACTESLIKVGRADPEWKQETRDSYMVKRGQAQGLAFAIMHYAKPHFPDVGSVSKHAVRRYKHKIGQLEEIEPTPGLDGFIVPPGGSKSVERATPKATAASAPKATGADLSKVSEETMALVKNGLGANLPVKTLAKLGKVSEATVEAIKASLKS